MPLVKVNLLKGRSRTMRRSQSPPRFRQLSPAQESGADRAVRSGIRPNVGRLSRLMSLGIADPQSFAVGVIAGVAATGLFVGFAALLVVGIS